MGGNSLWRLGAAQLVCHVSRLSRPSTGSSSGWLACARFHVACSHTDEHQNWQCRTCSIIFADRRRTRCVGHKRGLNHWLLTSGTEGWPSGTWWWYWLDYCVGCRKTMLISRVPTRRRISSPRNNAIDEANPTKIPTSSSSPGSRSGASCPERWRGSTPKSSTGLSDRTRSRSNTSGRSQRLRHGEPRRLPHQAPRCGTRLAYLWAAIPGGACADSAEHAGSTELDTTPAFSSTSASEAAQERAEVVAMYRSSPALAQLERGCCTCLLRR